MSELRFDALIFDLDDTLTDTEGQLVTRARMESIQEMAKNGMSFSIEYAQELWRNYLLQPRHGDVFEFIASHHKPVEEQKKLAQLGREIFYHRDIPSTFHAFTESGEILSQLKTKYDLYLVTTGDVETQKRKVQLTHLTSFFNAIFYIDHMKGEKKNSAFQQILFRHDGPPARILTIGNRLDHEIREGKRLGFQTCWVKQGEHRFQQPLAQHDRPDFTVDHIREMIRKCQL